MHLTGALGVELATDARPPAADMDHPRC
jgi:hypothetical protein